MTDLLPSTTDLPTEVPLGTEGGRRELDGSPREDHFSRYRPTLSNSNLFGTNRHLHKLKEVISIMTD